VLIHVNGVCDELVDKGYFSEIIDFGQLLIDPWTAAIVSQRL